MLFLRLLFCATAFLAWPTHASFGGRCLNWVIKTFTPKPASTEVVSSTPTKQHSAPQVDSSTPKPIEDEAPPKIATQIPPRSNAVPPIPRHLTQVTGPIPYSPVVAAKAPEVDVPQLKVAPNEVLRMDYKLADVSRTTEDNLSGYRDLEVSVSHENINEVANSLGMGDPDRVNKITEELRSRLLNRNELVMVSLSSLLPKHVQDVTGQCTTNNCAGAAAFFHNMNPNEKPFNVFHVDKFDDYDLVTKPRFGDVMVYSPKLWPNQNVPTNAAEVFGRNRSGFGTMFADTFKHLAIYVNDDWVWHSAGADPRAPYIYQSRTSTSAEFSGTDIYYLRPRSPTNESKD